MPTRRYFVNAAPMLNLTAGVSDSDTSISVSDTSEYPSSFPFTVCLERSTANEEVCLVTSKTSTSFTVTRGWDGTAAISHLNGSSVEHTTAAVDFNEASDHLTDASTDVHSQYMLKSLITGKGALVTGTASSTPSSLTVGSNNNVLIADSSAASGIKWGQVVSGGIASGAVTFDKLDSSLQQDVIQSSSSAPTSTSNGQVYYNTSSNIFYGRRDGAWTPIPTGINKVTYSTSSPSGGANGDVWLKYI